MQESFPQEHRETTKKPEEGSMVFRASARNTILQKKKFRSAEGLYSRAFGNNPNKPTGFSIIVALEAAKLYDWSRQVC
jgi:hypothetical protein